MTFHQAVESKETSWIFEWQLMSWFVQPDNPSRPASSFPCSHSRSPEHTAEAVCKSAVSRQLRTALPA